MLQPEGVPEFDDPTKAQEWAKKYESDPKQAVFELIAAGANRPIDFYAKIVDQYGEPVSDATVKFSIAQSQTGGGWVNLDIPINTDSEGRIRLNNARGEIIHIVSISKEGYVFNESVKRRILNSKRTTADILLKTSATDPLVLNGWKVEEAAKIKTIDVSGKIIADGRVYSVDIDENSMSELQFKENSSGDISISITRKTSDTFTNPTRISREERLGWNFQLTIENGGVIEISDRNGYQFLAPESGYTSEVHESSEGNSDEIDKLYYVSLKNGQIYGTMRFTANPFFRQAYGSAGIFLTINTAKSRVLLSEETH